MSRSEVPDMADEALTLKDIKSSQEKTTTTTTTRGAAEEEDDDWCLSLHDFLSAMSTEPELISFFDRRIPLPSMTFKMTGGSSKR